MLIQFDPGAAVINFLIICSTRQASPTGEGLQLPRRRNVRIDKTYLSTPVTSVQSLLLRVMFSTARMPGGLIAKCSNH